MPNQFFSPEGDLENYFVTEYWLIDQYVGDELWAWGIGSAGRLGNGVTTGRISTPVTTFAGGTNWKQVEADFHVVAIKTDGTLWTWGQPGNGRLGNGATTGSISTPVTTFSGGTNWKQVSSGISNTAAIKTDGTLWVWGSGTFGVLGDAQQSDRSTPVTTFSGGTNWKQVSVGTFYTAAIKTDGTLWTWGYGGSGRLGNASTVSVSTPVTTFAGGTNWKQVRAGSNHTAAIKTDGTLWTWGNGGNGRLGNASTVSVSTPVTTFAGGTNWKQVGTFSDTMVSIKTDGTLWTWGYGLNGRLGNAVISGDTSTPITTFAGGTNWKQVSGGGSHTAAIKTDGTLWLWGPGGADGALGNAQVTNRLTPVTTFAGGTDWKQVSSGGYGTAAIKTDGTLWTWGSGAGGALGNATITNVSTPVTTFAGGTNWKQVSFSRTYSASAIKTDGTLWTWGFGDLSQLGNAVTAGSISTPVTTFSGGTNWKQVSFGVYHTSAIKTDGTLWTWGRSNVGQLGDAAVTNRSTPVTTFAGGTNWKQVSAGTDFTAAIESADFI